MKALQNTLIVIALFAALTSQAQVLTAHTYVEKTHISPKFGTRLGVYLPKSQIEVGGFYQYSAPVSKSELGSYTSYEKEFAGAYINYPLTINNPNLGLDLNLRTGLTNAKNFTITPTLLGHVKLLKQIYLNGGVGVRAFRPTYTFGIQLHLNH